MAMSRRQWPCACEQNHCCVVVMFKGDTCGHHRGRQFLVRAITEGNPLTISTVYPRFLSETRPERVAVKAPKALSKQEANEAWTDLEKALFLPDIFGVLGSGGDESRLLPLKQLLIRGLQPDFSFRGRPLLHRACESGDLALAELLFACGADLHARGGDEESLPIEVAAWCGQMQLLRLLLMNGSCFGQALHMATLAGHLEAVQLLLNYGCPPHVRIAGVSPLDLAIAACQAPIVNLLLQQPMLLDTGGAEERLHSQGIGRFGLAPRSRRLHLCCKLGGPRGGILKALLTQGGVGKQKEWWAILEAEDGQTPLSVAQLPMRLLLRPHCLDVWSTLLRHWTAPNLDTSLRTVLEQKGDPSCASGAGWTPLILCAMADRGDLCQLLLQFGADPFQAGPRGRSALLWADWYQASKALAVLKAEKREKRDDREGLKRLQQGLKDELASPIVTPLPADELVAAMNFPGLSFAELVEHQLQRQAEVWETSTSSGPSKLWAVGEEPEGDANSTESLQEILNQVDLGPVGHFDSMKSLVAAARLLVQAKIAGGAPADSANGALALYVLTLLDAKARERINQKWQSEVWAKTLLSSSGLAWQQLPAERSVVFRAVRLEGDLSSYRRPLELFAPRRPVSWPCPSYGTLDRRVAMAYLEDWKDAAIVFKIYCLTARRINEFSWLAGEDQSSALHESLIAPGTQFESSGLFELTDMALRRDVTMDATLRGEEFNLQEEVQLLPLATSDLPARRVLVILQEVVPAEDLRKAAENASATVRNKKTASYL
ncbi:unnamed protein product [Durusdinium trenchii]|uniref:Uncharacterized protein n=1 Tax=Durusdinium trenchii TaxID=1381693 RepID=A0ABP0HNS5_9DINO